MKTIVRASFETLGLLFLFIAFGLFFDSTYFIKYAVYGQSIANILMLIVFVFLILKGTKRAKELMLYALIIGTVGEYLFSLGFEMYTYRLKNVPIYVPPGHAIIYIVTYYFTRKAPIQQSKDKIEFIFKVFIVIYSCVFLLLGNDVFGFVLSILIIWLLRNKPKERLFYYTMYIVVAFLEIIGTRYACWKWPSTAFDCIPFLKSANPPSGISFFYFGLDLGSLWLYKQRHLIAWKRMKAIRYSISSK